MLPGGVLGKKQLTKLKIYVGNDPDYTQNKVCADKVDAANPDDEGDGGLGQGPSVPRLGSVRLDDDAG